MLAPRDRRVDRARHRRCGRCRFWPCPVGIGHGDVARRDQADARGAAELDLRLADLLALAQQRPRLPGVEAPLHEAHQFLDPLVEAGKAGDDHDDPPPVLVGRAGEAVARLVGMAGLEAVGAGDAAEQRVAIVLGDRLVGAHRLAPGEVPEAVIAHGRARGSRGWSRRRAWRDRGRWCRSRRRRASRPDCPSANWRGPSPATAGSSARRRPAPSPKCTRRGRRVASLPDKRDDAAQQIGDADLLAGREEHGDPAAVPCHCCQVSGRTVQILLGSSWPRLIRSKATWVVIIFAIDAGGMRRSASLA